MTPIQGCRLTRAQSRQPERSSSEGIGSRTEACECPQPWIPEGVLVLAVQAQKEGSVTSGFAPGGRVVDAATLAVKDAAALAPVEETLAAIPTGVRDRLVGGPAELDPPEGDPRGRAWPPWSTRPHAVLRAKRLPVAR
jgi:hypothetical protein